MCGLALTILVSQLPKLCGFSVDADGLIPEAAAVVRGVAAGEVVPAALLVGVSGIVLIKVLQWWLPKVPGVLATVVVSIVAAAVLGLEGRGSSWSACFRRACPG